MGVVLPPMARMRAGGVAFVTWQSLAPRCAIRFSGDRMGGPVGGCTGQSSLSATEYRAPCVNYLEVLVPNGAPEEIAWICTSTKPSTCSMRTACP